MPWRKTKNPYKIWLSEIILQQTRVNQGLPYYLKFTEMFPTINILADADEEVVLRAWQGLGYYSRARNLHETAKIICSEKSAKFPESYAELINLPGIGPYTAAAISSFAYGEQVAVVDGNVLRVLARVFGLDRDIKKPLGPFREKANRLIPADNPGEFNQAIMEFGAMQCTPGMPDCPSCILHNHCYAFKNGKQLELPVKSGRKASRKRYFHYLVIKQHERILMRPRGSSDIWQGLYDFPLIETDDFLETEDLLNSMDKLLETEYIVEEISGEYRHVLSHQNIHAKFIQIHVADPFNLPTEKLGKMQAAGPQERENLPKPVLISRYLNDHNF